MSIGIPMLLLALACGGCDSMRPESASTVITLLVAYTPDVSDAAGDLPLVVDRTLQQTNRVFETDDIPIRLELAHMAEMEYVTTERLQDLERLIRNGDGHLDALHALRDSHEADVGILLVDDRSLTANGAVLAEEATAFAVIFWETIGAPDYALAHELGHLMGARHSPDADPLTEPFPYGHGFRNDSIKTIMSTGRLEVVPHFSSPDLTLDGAALGDSSQRDVRRVLRETAVYVSNFRGPKTPTDFVPPGTWPTVPPGL